jgi:hypothetical protein
MDSWCLAEYESMALDKDRMPSKDKQFPADRQARDWEDNCRRGYHSRVRGSCRRVRHGRGLRALSDFLDRRRDNRCLIFRMMKLFKCIPQGIFQLGRQGGKAIMTPDERRAIGRKASKAAGEARRRKEKVGSIRDLRHSPLQSDVHFAQRLSGVGGRQFSSLSRRRNGELDAVSFFTEELFASNPEPLASHWRACRDHANNIHRPGRRGSFLPGQRDADRR